MAAIVSAVTIGGAIACGSRTGILGGDGVGGDDPTANNQLGNADLDGGFAFDGARKRDAGFHVLPDGAMVPNDDDDANAPPPDPCPIPPGLQADAPWPMFRRCPLHTGRTLAVGPKTPTLKWKYQTPYAFQASPTIAADGTIYAGSDKVYAFNPDGTLKWSFLMNHPTGSGASPAIAADGTVYVASDDGTLYAINPDGSQKWRTDGLSLEYSAIMIGPDGTLYAGSTFGNSIYAVNPDGTTRWQIVTDEWQPGSPAMYNGTLFVGSNSGDLFAFSPEGQSKWKYPLAIGWIAQVIASPLIGPDGTIYQGTDVVDDQGGGNSKPTPAYFYALTADGKLKWRYQTEGPIQSSAGIGADGTLYFLSWGTMNAINGDGTKRWSLPVSTPTAPQASAAIDGDGTVYILAPYLQAFTPDGQVMWSYDTHPGKQNDGSVAIGKDGTLYVGSQDGNLYAFHD